MARATRTRGSDRLVSMSSRTESTSRSWNRGVQVSRTSHGDLLVSISSSRSGMLPVVHWVVSGRDTVVNGRELVVTGRDTVVNGRDTVVSGREFFVSGREFVVSKRELCCVVGV